MLVRGELDSDPRFRQVFVEAITVYSSAYRKAKQAKEELDRANSESTEKKSEKNPSLVEVEKVESQIADRRKW